MGGFLRHLQLFGRRNFLLSGPIFGLFTPASICTFYADQRWANKHAFSGYLTLNTVNTAIPWSLQSIDGVEVTSLPLY